MADEQNNSRQQRTVLLATDNKNSVLAEIAGGKPNPIAYSAYGQQSAQQEIATRLGFNGELREAQIGWYLLGNGYRAYNPRLMRFHSPDSWSPFGRGGLNAYMYCVGDPVNFSDPTGHAGWRSFLSGSFNFFFGGADVTGPSRTRGLMATGTAEATFFERLPLDDISRRQMRPEKTRVLKALDTLGTITASAPGPRGTNNPPLHNLGEAGRQPLGYVEGAAGAGLTNYGVTHSTATTTNPTRSAGSVNSDRHTTWKGNQYESRREHNQLQGDAARGRDLSGNYQLQGFEARELRLHRTLAREREVHDFMQMRAEELRRAGQNPQRFAQDIAREALDVGTRFNARFPPIRHP